MIRTRIKRLVHSVLLGVATVLLTIGDLATPVLAAARRFQDPAPEWRPRLWDRTGGRTANESRD